ncbi:DODA-type extradiol aromatic ring-opening family dioxygenase [Aquaspirillum serpens]|uniref:DODA-type extradiol aromatic ring-opening family dioxygenase n=1 Tax=Aquaspirillum serpens TaxID=190 RepID=UPI0003B5BF16|nr:class III extradiol ring-cleavage dioxygenase [Aquaspirillum serpens]
MQTTQPILFVPHGAPTMALQPGAAGMALAELGRRLTTPRAIVIISPHWMTAHPTVGYAPRPATVHDFWGFPAALYQLDYPATGCPEVAKLVSDLLQSQGFATQPAAEQGLDHGAWIPLRLLFPEASVPVVPLSLVANPDPRYHFQLGQALAPLAQQNILLIASGNLTHNLRDFQLSQREGGTDLHYVTAFADWMAQRLAEQDWPALFDYRRQAPAAQRAHPTDEHLLPLFVALGAASLHHHQPQAFHRGISDAVICMDGYQWPTRENTQ